MRSTIHEYMMAMAQVAKTRSTCLRRAVGCVLVDEHGRVLATGYNGVARGQPHCNEERRTPNPRAGAENEDRYDVMDVVTHPHACKGALLPSGVGHDDCGAIHAEANALVWCREPQNVWAAYVTTAPCVACVKLLLGTMCREVHFAEDHPMAAAAGELWTKSGRAWLPMLQKRL